MVQFLSINFFLGFLQFLLGFSKVPVFLCHSVYNKNLYLLMLAPLLCEPLFIASPLYMKDTPLNFYTFEDQILPNYYSLLEFYSQALC